MKVYEDFVLIGEYCEQENKYRQNNRGTFWSMIGKFLEQNTRYELVHPI